ncbi:MAG: NAD(P)/FAD-dependent oxidoreductase [Pseudomonadota bacterium]
MDRQSGAISEGAAAPQEFDVVVVGAGFSGLYALHKLRNEMGLRVRVLDKAGGIGGTWYWNRYPGARCDSESYYYSYSFSPELEQEWEWTERYPDHHEIRRYLNFVADKFELRSDIQLDTAVAGAAFDEDANQWVIATEGGDTFRARFFISAVGCLSNANVPDVPGLERFEGNWYHTGQWPHEGVDLSGKRVGQIGTGSTGIQVAPEVAKVAAHLTVFQRTANYSVPARNAPLTEEFKRDVKENYREIRAWAKRMTNGHPFNIRDASVLDFDDHERTALLEEAWATGGLRFRSAFRDVLSSREANDKVSDFIRDKIREAVSDPKTAAKLTPNDHGYATKRPPIDTHYFEAFNNEHVDVVDLKAEPLVEISAQGIVTEAREYPVDVIIFATGFDAFTGAVLGLNIQGRGGQPLADAWAAGPRNYLGLQVPGFPNFFTITGPGSPSVLCNMPVAIEQHVEWIAGCIGHMVEAGLSVIEPSAEAADEWVAHANEAANGTLLPQASSSWYLGANIPGKPRIFMPYAGGMNRYASICEDVVEDGFRGFQLR